MFDVNNAYVLLLDERTREQTMFRGVILSIDVLFYVYLFIEFIFMDNSVITHEKT
jgi:hypothetical protein